MNLNNRPIRKFVDQYRVSDSSFGGFSEAAKRIVCFQIYVSWVEIKGFRAEERKKWPEVHYFRVISLDKKSNGPGHW